MQKRFQPTFDAEDLMRLPNYTSVAQVLIHSVPSAPFSMDWIPSMGHPNPKLADALKKLSAAKYGRPRAEVELEIHKRLNAAAEAKEKDKQARLEAMRNSSLPPGVTNRQQPIGQGQAGAPASTPPAGGSGIPQAAPSGPTTPSLGAPPPPAAAPAGNSNGGSSFLDSWLSKRQNVKPISQPPAGMTIGGGASSQPLKPSAPVSAQPAVVPAQTSTGAVTTQPVAPSPEPTSAAPSTPLSQRPESNMIEQNEEVVIADQLRKAQSAAQGTMEEAKEAAAKVMEQRPAELRTVDDGVDEIFIDLRGNIHGGEGFNNIIEK
jgi:hypothetical protein